MFTFAVIELEQRIANIRCSVQLLQILQTHCLYLSEIKDTFTRVSSLIHYYYYYSLKRSAVQGWERVIYTLSDRTPQPHNTNL